MQKKKILVCGATGFIGRHMIEKFSQREDMEVYGTYFKTEPKGSIVNSKVKLIKADLTDKNQVDQVVKGMDYIVQAAAVTTGAKDTITRPYIHVTDNAVMNSILYRAAFEHKVQHVVFFSCTTMYPSSEKPAREEDFNYQILDKYFGVAWTKVYIEKMCEFYSRISKTKYTAIRHSNIYGPYDKFDLERSHVFGATVTKVMTAKEGKISVWGDGMEIRDLLYVSDLVDFVEGTLNSQQDPFVLCNLGSGEPVTIRQLVQKIIDITGRQLKMEFDLSKPFIKFNLAVDATKARQKFNWQPKVSLEEGIRKTVEWYKKNITV